LVPTTLRAADWKKPSFNPFAPVSLLPSGEAAALGPASCDGVEQWLSGMKLRELAEDWGIQRTRAFLSRHGHRNANRILDKYAAFLPSGHAVSAPACSRSIRHRLKSSSRHEGWAAVKGVSVSSSFA
jgi:hypothetical protein